MILPLRYADEIYHNKGCNYTPYNIFFKSKHQTRIRFLLKIHVSSASWNDITASYEVRIMKAALAVGLGGGADILVDDLIIEVS